VTGTDYPSVALSSSIMACDLADIGFEICNVQVDYEYDTPFGASVTFPFYFQQELSVRLDDANRLLGSSLTMREALEALTRMGLCAYSMDGVLIFVAPPEYRNDFLHPVDIIEDILVGNGLEHFTPERPSDFTIGRLTSLELFSRSAKSILVGLGYQEMIYNYLGSGKDFVERMRISARNLVKISNPMTENYEYVRNSPLPGLMQTESVSGKASYPHRTFEVGKVALKAPDSNYGIATRQYLAFLISHPEADYNEIASHVATLMYLLGKEYTIQASSDARFIEGRQVEVYVNGNRAGLFGEVHPEVLDAFGVTMPCAAGELDLEILLES